MSGRALVDGVGIAYDVTGPPDAPAVVLVHSLGQDRSMWRAQVRSWGDHHRLLAVDLRGHGRSDAPDGRYSIAMLAGDVLAAAADAGIDRFHLCGVSIGGLVAQWLAVDAPERLRSLVASNTAARIGSEASWRERIDLIRTLGMEASAERIVPGWFTPGFPKREPEEYARAFGLFRDTSPVGYTGGCSALADCDLRDQVGRIRVPTLVIGGELDRATPPDEARRLHEQIPGSTLEILEGAAHLSNVEAAEVFTRKVGAFIDGVPG